MAVTSLGRLTLDLAVKLAEFTDGMSKAERQTKQKTEQMSKSVNDFKGNLLDGLDGTAVGSAFRNLDNNFRGAGSAAGLAGLAIGALGAAALGATVGVAALIREQTQLAQEVTRYANIANASTTAMQKTAFAAKSVGFEMDKLADIYKDVQDKVGDFITTGGGAMKDFFEYIAPQVGVTAEEFRKLSGPDALQMYYDSLEKANIGQAEMVFYMEAIASDATALIPLLRNGGEGFDLWADAAEKAGAVMDEETIRATQELTTSTDLLKLSLAGAKNQVVKEVLPVVSDMAAAFVTDANAKELAKSAGEMLAGGLLILAKTGVATVTVFQGLGIIVSTVAGSFAQLFRGVSLSDNAIMMALKMAGNFQTTGRIISEGDADFKRINARMTTMINNINQLGKSGVTNPLVHTLTDITVLSGNLNSELGLTGQQIEANAEAADKSAKKTAKAVKELSRMEQVHAAFVKAGMSDNQARIMTAEVGREGSFLDKNLFGYHNDPKNGKVNVGMISWQKDRGQALIKELTSLGLIKNGKMVQSQEALDAQAAFVVKEMLGNKRFERTKNQFLLDPNVSYDKGKEVLGRNYIAWRYDDKAFASGHRNRDDFYDQINAKLGNKGLAADLAKEQKEVERQLEAQQQAQTSIAVRYAKDREKLKLEHLQRNEEIERAFGVGSKEAQHYLELEKVEYQDKINKKALSVAERYFTEDRKLLLEHEAAMASIKENLDPSTPEYQLALDAQEAYFQKEMQRIRYQDGEKYRQAQKHIGDIRSLIEAGAQSAQDRVMDIFNRGSMSPADYARLGLNRERQSALAAAGKTFNETEERINERDGYGDYIYQTEERNKLLKEAKLAHEAEMYAIDVEYADKREALEKELAETRVQLNSEGFGAMTDAAAMFFGESSGLYKAAFAVEKAYAIQQALMNVEETYSNTLASASAIPLIGPYIAQPMAIAASAMQVARAANIRGMTLGGIAHGGLDYVPSESTYLLDKGERVLSPNQNRDLTKFMQNSGTGSPQITVINNAPGYEAVTTTNADGSIDVKIEKRIQQSWSNLQNPNSHESKMLGRNVQAPRRR